MRELPLNTNQKELLTWLKTGWWSRGHKHAEKEHSPFLYLTGHFLIGIKSSFISRGFRALQSVNHYYLDFNFKSVSHHFSNYSSVLFISFHFVLEIKIPHQIVLFLLIYFPLYIFFSSFNLMYFLNLYYSLRFTSRFTSVYMNTQGTSLSSSSSSSSSPWQSFRKFFAGLVFAAWLRIYVWPFLDNKERTWGRKINFVRALEKAKEEFKVCYHYSLKKLCIFNEKFFSLQF